MKENFSDKFDRLRSLFEKAECVLIGGGAGFSSAAGLTYSGERFAANFGDFIARYGLTDMYSAAFYPFPTQEESGRIGRGISSSTAGSRPRCRTIKDSLRL